jgi:transposase InsO family protein
MKLHGNARTCPHSRRLRTLLGGWAYGAIYRDSDERRRALSGWLHFYNHRRPHGSLSHQPPATAARGAQEEQPRRVLHARRANPVALGSR